MTSRSPLPSRRLLGLLAPLCLAACAQSALPAAPAASPAEPAAEPAPDTLVSDLKQRAAELDAELARLEQAKHEEGEGRGAGTPAAEPTVGQAQPNAQQSTPTAASASPKEDQADRGPEKKAAPGDRCHTACRALDSMQRSSERICAITGDANEKCAWARSQVKEARERVAGAGCDCEK